MKLVKGDRVFVTENTNVITAFKEAGFVEEKLAPKKKEK